MRYIPHTPEEVRDMLAVCGVSSIEDLFRTIPKALRCRGDLNLPKALDERALLDHAQDLSGTNAVGPQSRSFLGGGVYRHYIPQAVEDIVRRSEFLTPYTPYQPEVAQGTLQTIFEFQTMVSEIFGMPVANASTYDGSTSLAESLLMGLRIGKKRKKLLIPANVHPEYREVARTLLNGFGDSLVSIPYTPSGTIDRAALGDYLNDALAACVIGYPNFFGIVEDVSDIVAKVHQAGGLVLTTTPEPLSLGLFSPPGEWGADIATGEGQSLGLAPSFGGPLVGLFAAREEFLRQMPGRLCGMTTDTKGRRGFVLTLSTREQHIRRAKATSTICTNQALCATQMTVYLSLLGKEGFKKLALLNWQRTEYARKKLAAVSGVSLPFCGTHFNEFVLTTHQPADIVLQKLSERGWAGGIDLGRWYPELANGILVSVTEFNDKETIDRFVEDFKGVLKK